MLEKIVRIGTLSAFYGSLLTEKQRRIVELYYDNDLSLGEIAAEYGISRQAVYDLLQRTEKLLEKYEKKLALAEKYRQKKARLAECRRLLAETLLSGAAAADPTIESKLGDIADILDEFLAE
ncbi:MAG: YlxM family DNA-binding protein [bacterium]